MILFNKFYDEESDAGTTGEPKTFTQEEVNSLLAKNKRTLQEQNAKQAATNIAQAAQLEQLKSKAQLSGEETQELNLKIEQLQTEFLSKEELAARQLEQTQTELQVKLDQTASQANEWQGRYASSTIQRELQEAAVQNKAVASDQIVQYLKGQTQLQEVKKDGVATGEYAPVVSFSDVDKDGNQVTLEISPMEAVKRMTEKTELYGNLFLSDAKGGAGNLGSQTNNNNSNTVDALKDTQKYMEARNKGNHLDNIQSES